MMDSTTAGHYFSSAAHPQAERVLPFPTTSIRNHLHVPRSTGATGSFSTEFYEELPSSDLNDEEREHLECEELLEEFSQNELVEYLRWKEYLDCSSNEASNRQQFSNAMCCSCRKKPATQHKSIQANQDTKGIPPSWVMEAKDQVDSIHVQITNFINTFLHHPAAQNCKNGKASVRESNKKSKDLDSKKCKKAAAASLDTKKTGNADLESQLKSISEAVLKLKCIIPTLHTFSDEMKPINSNQPEGFLSNSGINCSSSAIQETPVVNRIFLETAAEVLGMGGQAFLKQPLVSKENEIQKIVKELKAIGSSFACGASNVVQETPVINTIFKLEAAAEVGRMDSQALLEQPLVGEEHGIQEIEKELMTFESSTICGTEDVGLQKRDVETQTEEPEIDSKYLKSFPRKKTHCPATAAATKDHNDLKSEMANGKSLGKDGVPISQKNGFAAASTDSLPYNKSKIKAQTFQKPVKSLNVQSRRKMEPETLNKNSRNVNIKLNACASSSQGTSVRSELLPKTAGSSKQMGPSIYTNSRRDTVRKNVRAEVTLQNNGKSLNNTKIEIQKTKHLS